MGRFVTTQNAQAMLCTDGALSGHDLIVNDAPNPVLVGLDILATGVVTALAIESLKQLSRCGHIEVQVAVTQVAKVRQANAGVGLAKLVLGDPTELGNRRDGQGDVELHLQAILGGRHGDVLAQVPEGLGLLHALGHQGIDDQVLFHGHL